MKKISSLVYLFLSLILTQISFGQGNVGIGTASPNSNALLDLTSSTQGLLVPRMPATNRLAIVNPVDGLMVYDTDSDCFFFFSATANNWTSLCQVGGGGTPIAAYNTAVTFNQATDSLSVTDPAGTLSTLIPQERWSADPMTDISMTTGTIPTFTPMAGDTVTFTPHTSVVYITATVSGDADTTTNGPVQGLIAIQLINVGFNFIITGSSTSFTSSPLVPMPWNVALSNAYQVTPGVPVTVGLIWAAEYVDLSSHKINCMSRTDEYQASRRTIIVSE